MYAHGRLRLDCGRVNPPQPAIREYEGYFPWFHLDHSARIFIVAPPDIPRPNTDTSDLFLDMKPLLWHLSAWFARLRSAVSGVFPTDQIIRCSTRILILPTQKPIHS